MRLSYSALDTFKQCPQKYKFQYVDKISVPKSKEAIFGTLIHNALGQFHDPERIVSPTEEELLDFWSANWVPSAFGDTREEAAAFAQGVLILKNYFAKNAPLLFNIAALETPFEAQIKVGNDIHLITGKIDRIDKIENDLFEVIDYKTAKKMPAQKNVDHNLQLSVYHIGIANRWPKIVQENRPVKTSLYFLKHGEKLSSIKTNDDLAETKENLVVFLEKIQKAHEQEDFPPHPGPLCDWCAYQRWCPLFKHKFIEEKIFFNDQDIKALINEYISLKDDDLQRNKRMAEIKNTFAKFMDQEGMERLFSDSGFITRQTIQRYAYDPQMIKEILESIGRWQEILKIDEAKLKKIIKDLPADLRRKIEENKKISREYKNFSVSLIKKPMD